VARYFVTGATGFIGGELTKQLIGRGHEVVAVVRSPEKTALLKTLGVKLHTGDITDRESLRAPMQGVDGVFHVAAWYKIGVTEPAAEAINVGGTRNVLETARELGIPRLVYTSTVGVFGDTRGRVVDESYYARGPFLTEYDRTKWIAHYEVAVPMARAGLPLVIAMPGLVYGPGDTSAVRASLTQLLRGRLFITPSRVAFSWGYIEDTARGLRLAMETGRAGESYLLTGPAHTFQEAFALAARIAAKRSPPVHPPPLVMKLLAGTTALLERLGAKGPYDSETLRLMAGTTWIGSSAKAERELGFTTRSLDEGLRHTIEHELRQLGMA
jgi:nucleoside-diphosphate-sugar epimerase